MQSIHHAVIKESAQSKQRANLHSLLNSFKACVGFQLEFSIV